MSSKVPSSASARSAPVTGLEEPVDDPQVLAGLGVDGLRLAALRASGAVA